MTSTRMDGVRPSPRLLARATTACLLIAVLTIASDFADAADGPGSADRESTPVGDVRGSTGTATGVLVPLDVLRPVLDGLNDTPDESVEFGRSVSVDGDWMLVGVPFRVGNNGRTYGAVFSYQRVSPSRWEQRQRILFGSGGDPRCGSAVALSGRHAVIGCPRHTSDGLALRGRTVFYERNALTGLYESAQSVLGDAANFACGSSVAIHGTGEAGTTWAVTGCPHLSSSSDGPPGTTDVFQRVEVGGNGIWQRIQTLTSSTPPVAGDFGYRFGASVAIHRAMSGLVRIAVGESGQGSQGGIAHLFRREAVGGFFGLEISRTRPGGARPGDSCGWSVALGPADWFVGCPWTQDGGIVLAFQLDGMQWNAGTQVPAPAGLAQPGSRFGWAVATSSSGTAGDLWVGQPSAEGPGAVTEVGRALRFQRVGGAPTPQPPLYVPVAHWHAHELGITNQYARLGRAIAVDNASGTATVGAPEATIPEPWGEVIVFGPDRIFANGLGCGAGLPGC